MYRIAICDDEKIINESESTARGAQINLVIKKKQNKYHVHVDAIGDKEYVLMALERAIEALGGTDND